MEKIICLAGAILFAGVNTGFTAGLEELRSGSVLSHPNPEALEAIAVETPKWLKVENTGPDTSLSARQLQVITLANGRKVSLDLTKTDRFTGGEYSYKIVGTRPALEAQVSKMQNTLRDIGRVKAEYFQVYDIYKAMLTIRTGKNVNMEVYRYSGFLADLNEENTTIKEILTALSLKWDNGLLLDAVQYARCGDAPIGTANCLYSFQIMRLTR